MASYHESNLANIQYFFDTFSFDVEIVFYNDMGLLDKLLSQ